MKNKIILLQVTPVFPTFINKWCIDELHDLDYDTVILDTSPVIKPKVNDHLKQKRLESIPELGIEYKKIENWKELKKFFAENRNEFFFTMFYNLYEERLIYFLLWKYSIRYANLSGISSELGVDDDIVDLKIWEKLRFTHIKMVLYNRILRKVFPYKKPEFIALSAKTNEEYQCKVNMCNKGVRRVRLYSYDYENYLRTEIYDNKQRPYCVFLDSFVPFHPDFVIDGKIRVAADTYYKEINLIFQAVRKRLGLDIIVAAHPRANIEDEQKYFPNSVIEYGKTSNLVKGASLILAHFSNSIAYGIMANKPIVIINNSAISVVRAFDARCKRYSMYLKLKLIKEANDVSSELLAFNRDNYKDFLLQKVTYEIKEKPGFWAELIKNIFI